MRDDLHSGAPVARHWRSVVRKCSNDATWRIDGASSFERALCRDANELLRDSVIEATRAKVEGRTLFGPDPTCWADGDFTPVEREFQRIVARGAGPTSLEEALTAALTEHVHQVGRQVTAHVYSRDSSNSREFVRRFKASQSNDLIRAVACLRLTGQKAVPQLPRQVIGLDDDIRA